MVDSAAALVSAALFGKGKDPPPREYGILPQQSENQLLLGEAHSKLDAALAFLQKHVGYAMLDDAEARHGGAVGVPAPKAGARSGGVRAEQANEGRWPKESAMSVIVREGEGHMSGRDSEKGQLIFMEELRSEREKELAEVKTVVLPAAAKYAHFEEDLLLLSRFTQILCGGAPGAVTKVQNQGVYKTVLQAIRLLHLCEYEYTDVVLVLAHASVYFRSTFAAVGHRMGEHEAAHVLVLLIYLAHSFILDISCPLRCWQKHIFRKYCTLKVLDAALFRLFKMRKFLLRVTESEEQVALQHLFGHSHPALANGHPNGLPNGFSNGSASHHHDAAAGREPARPPRPG